MFSSGSSLLRSLQGLGAVAAASLWAPERPPEERVVPLARQALEQDLHRLAPGVAGKLPRHAYAATVDERTYLLVDLDGNRRIEPGHDGLALAGFASVVVLPEELLLPSGAFAFELDGVRRLRLFPRGELAPELLPHVAALTELRVRAGVAPLRIDAEASAHAALHLDYLATNRVIRGALTLDAHREDPRRPGYTPEGAKAGRAGLLGTGRTLTEDMLGWYASTFHGAILLDPALREVGLARKHGVSLLYPVGHDEPARRSRELVVHPPDGARGVPPGFAPGGEVPSPVPGRRLGRGTGFPLTVRLPRAWRNRPVLHFELRDADGVEQPGYVSSPREPASPDFPDNAGCAFFVPRTRLEDGTVYSASFRLEGMAEPLRWSFRTWEWEPRPR